MTVRNELLGEFRREADNCGLLPMLEPYLINPSRLGLTDTGVYYHDFEHVISVAVLAARMVQGREDKKLLLLAGLFHDAGHTLDGSLGDAHNIDRALALVPHFRQRFQTLRVKSLILSTQQGEGHKERVQHGGALARVLADADLMASLVVERAEARMAHEGMTVVPQVEFFRSRKMWTHAGAGFVEQHLGLRPEVYP